MHRTIWQDQTCHDFSHFASGCPNSLPSTPIYGDPKVKGQRMTIKNSRRREVDAMGKGMGGSGGGGGRGWGWGGGICMGTAPAECGKGRYDTADLKRCLQPMLAWPGLWLSETARTVAVFTGGQQIVAVLSVGTTELDSGWYTPAALAPRRLTRSFVGFSYARSSAQEII